MPEIFHGRNLLVNTFLKASLKIGINYERTDKMKKLSAELLDSPLYVDRERTIIAKNAKNEDLTARLYILFALDQPSNVKYSRELSKKIDRIYDAVLNDIPLEEVDFDHLKTLVDSGMITNKFVFDNISKIIDSAETVNLKSV